MVIESSSRAFDVWHCSANFRPARAYTEPIRAVAPLPMQPVRIEIQWQLNLANLNVFDNCYCWDFFMFKDWHVVHTLYMRRFASRAKALGGKLNPQLPLQTRFVLQSSHTYSLFSLATRWDIFVLFLPHLAHVGNWHSRHTLCICPDFSRPNADGGKPHWHVPRIDHSNVRERSMSFAKHFNSPWINRLCERWFDLDCWIANFHFLNLCLHSEFTNRRSWLFDLDCLSGCPVIKFWWVGLLVDKS